jgi:hypothetical protein
MFAVFRISRFDRKLPPQRGGRMNGIARLAWCLLSSACAGAYDAEAIRQSAPRGDPVLATARVENGVTVYGHAAGALDRAPPWKLESDPVVTIGGADGDPNYDLTGVSYVVPLSDGRVMTFARIGNKVFVFGRDGKGERVIGRTGQGPGDWMRFGDPVLLKNDTVLVLDFANNRLNWVTADGGIVRTAPYDVTGEMRRMNQIAGFLSTGELLLHSAGTWGGHLTDSLHRSLAGVVAAKIVNGSSNVTPELPRDAAAFRTLTSVPDMQGSLVETRYRGRVRSVWQPVRLGGSALLAAWDSAYASVMAWSRTIELRDANGSLGARIEVPVRRRAVTPAMRDARIATELGWLSAPGSEGLIDRAESQRLAREAPFADSLPYFEHLVVGSDGTLWVVDAIAPNDSGWTATALRNDGAILGRLAATGRSVPMAFGANQVIVRAEDENGVVSLRVYRFMDRR